MTGVLYTLQASGWPVTGAIWSVLGTVMLWCGAIVAGLLLLLLLVPIQLRVRGDLRDATLSGQAEGRWGWGLVSVRIGADRTATLHLMGIRIYRLKPRDRRPPPKPARARKRGGMKWLIQYRRVLWRLMARLAGTLRLQARITGELGLDDPAATALLVQLLWELNDRLERVTLEVHPDYLDETFSVAGEARALLWPLHVGLVLLGALLQRETREMLRAAP